MTKPLRVGIVGISPARGWAQAAHIPALRALPNFEVTAVCTRRMESAQAAARHFGVPLAFDDARSLAAHPDVDVVTVCVSIPGHCQAITAAADAGKPIFCEGPILCATLPEAIGVAALVRERRIRTIVGLQSRESPTIAFAKDLIVQGYVGQVLSCMMTTTWRVWGEATPLANAYAFDPQNNASALSIAGGHGIDVMQYLLGRFRRLSGTTRIQRDRVKILETGEYQPATAIQQFAVHGELEGGAIASIHIQGGAYRGGGFRLEINGTDGDLILSSDMPFGVTSPDLKIRGVRKPQESFSELDVPDRYVRAPAMVARGPALGTAHLYLNLAQAIEHGIEASPNFDEAERLLQVLHAIEVSSLSMEAQILPAPAANSASLG